MALEALAPDQRAVVQLVLQQERSYDELAGLLGISAEAVRDRARSGLDRLTDSGGLTSEERGELADYLLGQQSVSRRESTRALLNSSPEARDWARAVSAEITDLARSPLPEVPEGDGREAPTATFERAPEPDRFEPFEPFEPDEREDDQVDLTPTGTVTADEAMGRPRPRPRPHPIERLGAPAADRPRSSLIGGALLIFGVAAILAVVVVLLLRDGDEEPASTTPTATATATPTPPQAAAQIRMRAPDGGRARGEMTLYVTEQGQVQFTIEGRNVPPTREGEAYAVWLVGGDRPHRLGFAPAVPDSGEDRGRLGTSGPRDQDARQFPRWLAEADRVVVSRETTQDASRPGPIVLTGNIPRS